ncbi:DNA-binding protein [Streptomyces mashuensis]|uniref:DNA-binding protein n=1 Tax=Streptomyces mashuensis TaxID=33904 RepID=A0A919ECL7_9ACTN|nr:OB-fold domain-containing protein [Streptomyces mashuensis]GHF42349.1 DNA-binding protein [Streptomyces mashuensis]
MSPLAGPDDDDSLALRLAAYEGRPAAVAARGPDVVNPAMIRHWCEVMGDTDPVHQGPGAVAPAAMLQVWIMRGGAPRRSGGTPERSAAYEELLALLDDAGCTAVVATDCEQEYLRPLWPGDVITYDAVIESVSPRKTTRLGTGHFVTTRTEIRAGGELAGVHRFRILKYAPARTGTQGPRPRPVINRDTAGFWEGVAARRLLFQRCTDCGTPRFPWVPGCADCGSERWTAVRASGAGTVYTYTVVHHPPVPGATMPHCAGVIELAEGVRMATEIRGVAPEGLRVGLPVTVEYADAGGGGDAGGTGGGQLIPVFRPAATRDEGP